ncbi:hypothetical protein [Streptomyces sp. NPDC057580]|uniref:hypothetical protein n=1 Tax=Streptomyces sp. NPDC057580 TaxID=3346173 RepID=UPI0036B08D5F
MALFEQVAVPPQDRVGTHQQQEPAQLVHRETMEQASEQRTVGVGERGLADLALQDQQLVPQREDLDVFVPLTHRQQPQERERMGDGEVGQAQQHDRS